MTLIIIIVQTLVIADYSTTTDINTAIESSNTTLLNWIVAQVYLTEELDALAYNGTLAYLSDIISYSYYNSTDFSISDYSTKVAADLLYYGIDNPYSFYNSTNPQTETDPVWTADKISYSTTDEADTYYYGITNPYDFYNSTNPSPVINTSYYLVTNPFSFYNVTTAPIYINDTFAGNYSDF